MPRQKQKNWIRKIFTIVLFTIVLTILAPAIFQSLNPAESNHSTAYAAEKKLVCTGNGFKLSDDKQKCLNDTPNQICPTDYPLKEQSEPKTICLPSSAVTTSFTYDEQTKKAMFFMIAIQKLLNKLLWPLLVLIGGLMDNSLLFGNGMEARLREIWVPIRNIVNIFFVIALVGIALYNVLGLGEDQSQYSIKAILPKIIVGIIAVNFSFLGIKVMLDGVNVLTTSIFALPAQVGMSTGMTPGKDSDLIQRFCKVTQGKKVNESVDTKILEKETEEALKRNIIFKLAQQYGVVAGELKTLDKLTGKGLDDFVNVMQLGREQVPPGKPSVITQTKITPIPGIRAEYDKKVKQAKAGQFCAGLELSTQGEEFFAKYNGQNVALLMALDMGKVVFYEDLTANMNNIEKIFLSNVFSVILYVIYAASFVALFIVLLARLVVLWVALALSPVLLLIMTVPVIKEKMGEVSQVTGQFFKNALAPVGIALAMSIGWIMLNAIQGLNSISEGALRFDPSGGIPVAGLNTLQDLIVGIGVIGVVWAAVFAAANASIAKPITSMIQGGLKKAGGWVGTLPLKHLPAIPVDIPGQKPGRYTAEQVMAAIQGVGDTTNKKYDLSKLINGPPTKGIMKGMNQIKTGPQLLGQIYKHKNTTNADEGKKFFDRLAETTEGKTAIAEASRNRDIKNYIDSVMNGKTSKERKAAWEKLKNSQLVKSHEDDAPADITSPTKTKAKAAKKGPEIATPITPLDKIKESRWGGKEVTTTPELQQIVRKLEDLDRSFKQNPKNALNDLIKTPIAGNIIQSPEELKAIMVKTGREKTYEAIEIAVGGPDEVKKIIDAANTAKKKGGTPPAPGIPPAK